MPLFRFPSADFCCSLASCFFDACAFYPIVCATATIVGVSAVGYAIGRPDDQSSQPNLQKRKYSSEPFPTVRPSESMPRYSTTLSVPSTPLENRPSQFTGRASGDVLRSRNGRRLTTGGDVMDIDEHSDFGFRHDVAQRDPSVTLRSKSSWIKRLSTLSSNHSSPLGSPATESPPISFSNGSAAFSHSGSTAPIIGQCPPPPLPPNKLVKRSSSFRLSKGQMQEHIQSRRPTLRRPATSHQRSATLQMHSQSRGVSMDRARDVQIPVPVVESPPEPLYQQYFTAKVSKDNTVSKKRFGGERSARKIFPDDRFRPTLILAKSVMASSIEVDESLSLADDSDFGGSRPITPLGLGFGRPSPSESFDGSRGSYHPSGTTDSQRDFPPPEDTSAYQHRRRSFSLDKFLPSSSSFRKPRSSKYLGRSRLTRRSESRAISAPLPSTQETSSSDPDSGRPIKKRDTTDPTIFKREIYTSSSNSASINDMSSSQSNHVANPSQKPLSHSVHGLTHNHSSPPPYQTGTTSTDLDHFPLSPSTQVPGHRLVRNSIPQSERTSTLVGSDSELRGVTPAEEEETDLASETVFDSIRTRGTRSTSGARGPSIDQIFDMPPSSTVMAKPRSNFLRDMLPKGMGTDQEMELVGPDSITEEEESVSTNDEMAIASDLAEGGSPTTVRVRSKLQNQPLRIPSSPPEAAKSLNLGSLEYDNFQDQDDESRWSMGEPSNDSPNISLEDLSLNFDQVEQVATPLSIRRSSPHLVATGSSSSPPAITPNHRYSQLTERERDSRSNLFDWSEHPHTDKSPGNRTPPRPQTVHGKKDTDSRGSRSIGRRAPSALHARSQSVPVVPDPAGKRDTVVMNKFGTWGVGSKGVTEDWDDDFDFTNPNHEAGQSSTGGEEKRVDSGMAVVVPQNIRDQQLNVLANIGLLKEWGIIIEELKDLKIRAAQLGVLDGVGAAVWKEVDAMIDLADQEAEEDTAPRVTPPSSPGFDADAFEEEAGLTTPAPVNKNRRTRRSTSARFDGPTSVPQSSPRSRRKSVLPTNSDIFSEPAATSPPTQSFGIPRTPSGQHASSRTTPTTVTTRPRKDSEAIARSVIEALQKRPSTVSEPITFSRTSKEKKVPFDTATLKHIVPYVNGLVRKVRTLLRDVEGLSSPALGLLQYDASGHGGKANGVNGTDDGILGQWDITTDTISTTGVFDPGNTKSDLFGSPTKRAGSTTPSGIGSATGSPSSRRNRRTRANNGGVVPEEGGARSGAGVDELTGQMKLMTVI
ncbi:hypothetical protein P152DRAFT_447707 [Eremomyces bilateralis CBS 781.70]|uniref:Uncharacterized protein n=1 Tax=Eremomyces bilateralis CBS 781.70 TaxID=1392243 RepID=A0A6G1G8R8_9PEZI|nr:uncharacterized protein P152DRAFT_447707 [Eremomyces bilateralis CBS 781.70]KAF1814326.1 hypothetical protein P152DRAFT_447707 [Eremomyces bilateralis CBS 781.70]